MVKPEEFEKSQGSVPSSVLEVCLLLEKSFEVRFFIDDIVRCLA